MKLLETKHLITILREVYLVSLEELNDTIKYSLKQTNFIKKIKRLQLALCFLVQSWPHWVKILDVVWLPDLPDHEG